MKNGRVDHSMVRGLVSKARDRENRSAGSNPVSSANQLNDGGPNA